MAFQVKVVNKDNEAIPVMVFRNNGKNGPFYTVSVSDTMADGTKRYSSIVAYFSKEVEFENKTMINIREASLVPTSDKFKVALRVWKWDYSKDFKQVDTSTMSSGFQQVYDGLPF